MKRICSIALVLGILIQPTSSKAEFFMAGVGAVSCGTVAEGYRQDPTQTEGVMLYMGAGFYDWFERKSWRRSIPRFDSDDSR